MLGVALLESNQFDDAAHVFELLQGSQICVTDATINLAHCYLMRGRWSDAAAGYVAFARSRPMQHLQASVKLWLSRAYHGTGNTQLARRAVAAATHLQPSNLAFRKCIFRV